MQSGCQVSRCAVKNIYRLDNAYEAIFLTTHMLSTKKIGACTHLSRAHVTPAYDARPRSLAWRVCDHVKGRTGTGGKGHPLSLPDGG